MASQKINNNIVVDSTATPVNLDITGVNEIEYNFSGTTTLVNNIVALAQLAADAPYVPGSQTPSYMWDGMEIVVNWYARVNLDGFSYTILGRSLTQREANSDLVITAKYLDSQGGWNVQVQLIEEDRSYISLNYTEAAILVGVNGLIPGTTYIISETGMPNSDGEIQLVAVSEDKFDIIGKHTFSKPSIGAIYFADGGVGSSIDTITVDGNNILTGVIAWNTDLTTTVADAVLNIVANSGVSGFTAEQIIGTGAIIIYSVAPGASHNSESVAGTVTAGPSVLIISGSFNMEQGLDIGMLWTNIEYDFNSDTISSVSDWVGNKFTSASLPSSDFKKAPWGVTVFRENKMLNMPVGGVIIIGITGSVSGNTFNNVGVVIGNATGVVSNNTVIGAPTNYMSLIEAAADVKNNVIINGNLKVLTSGILDTISNNSITNAKVSAETPGVSITNCNIAGKSTWGSIEFLNSATELTISPLQSNLSGQTTIAANAIDLISDTLTGAGIIEIQNTDTLDTINNSTDMCDVFVLKPAAGTTLTLDPGTATNISTGTAVPIVLVGASEDFCVLRRGSAGTNWLVQSFNNF
jgi:hypothetical protein